MSGQPELPPPPPRRFSFEVHRLYRIQVVVMFVAFGVLVVAMLASLGSHDAPPAWFAATWIAAAAWNAYWFLFRIAYQLEAGDGMLRWSAPLRSGELPISDIVELRPGRVFASNIEVIVTSGHGKISVFVRKGLDEFARALKAGNPKIGYRFGWMGELLLGLPWARSGFGPDDRRP